MVCRKYAFRDTITYTYSRLSYATSPTKGYEYQLFLPTYNSVKWLEVGVPEGYELRFLPKSQERPIVVYGTSIAQGACSSRPGMAWPAIIDRVLEHPVINLGFSGNGQQEPETYGFLAELDAQLFIIDCMPNMNLDRIGYIYERTLNGVRKLREKTDALALISVCYYANVILNIVAAFRQFRSKPIFPIALVLFLLCDRVIGLQVAAGGYLPIGEDSWLYRLIFMNFNLSWFFYLPSQVLIALSSKK